MEGFQQRVVDEKTHLDEKCQKLAGFLNGPILMTLPLEERQLLVEQYGLMTQYSDVLGRRIALF